MPLIAVSKTTRELLLEWNASPVTLSSDLKLPQFEVEDVETTKCEETTSLIGESRRNNKPRMQGNFCRRISNFLAGSFAVVERCRGVGGTPRDSNLQVTSGPSSAKKGAREHLQAENSG